jgi:hypothetical protein
MNPRISSSLFGLMIVAVALAFAPEEGAKSIFDGKSPDGWLTNGDSKPLNAKNVQSDGLNPHGSGGYIVMYETPMKDFELDFDYKLSKGCNSGVFVRVGDPKDPVMTGLEIALDDTTGTGMHDSGAIYDLVAPKSNTQKPAGEWNHMKIVAKGPKIQVTINGEHVSSIDMDQWTEKGKRPDGSSHKFSEVTIKDLNQKGYFGFQDHGQNCWYKNVKVKAMD